MGGRLASLPHLVHRLEVLLAARGNIGRGGVGDLQRQLGSSLSGFPLCRLETLDLFLEASGFGDLRRAIAGGRAPDVSRRGILGGPRLLGLVGHRPPRFVDREHVGDEIVGDALARSAVAVRSVVTKPAKVDHAG